MTTMKNPARKRIVIGVACAAILVGVALVAALNFNRKVPRSQSTNSMTGTHKAQPLDTGYVSDFHRLVCHCEVPVPYEKSPKEGIAPSIRIFRELLCQRCTRMILDSSR